MSATGSLHKKLKIFLAKHTANLAIFAVKWISGIYSEPNFILGRSCMPEKKKMREIRNLISRFWQRIVGRNVWKTF